MSISEKLLRFKLVRSGPKRENVASESEIAQWKARLAEAMANAIDPTPPGQIDVRPGEGGHDTRYQCEAAEALLNSEGVVGAARLQLLLALTGGENRLGRQEGLLLNNLLARYYIAEGRYDDAMAAAEVAFQSWHMDILNHKIIIACRSRLGLLGGETEESINTYLESTYCDRPSEFFATTTIDKVFLCSTNYLTAPAADLSEIHTSMSDSPEVAAEKAWNSPAAQYIRRSIISGDYSYCSALTCPRIANRDLHKRKMDEVEGDLAGGPHLVQVGYYGFNIYYDRTRVFAVPVGERFARGSLAENVLVSYTLDDLQEQIEVLTETAADPIDRSWFNENDLAGSFVITLSESDPQYKIRSRMKQSPREIILSHDNSCNISCPSCRTETIISSKELNAKHDRLIPLMLGLIKEADYIVTSGAGDPFASRHFRRLLAAIGGQDFENFGTVARRPDFRVNLMTNGLQFTRRAYQQLGLKGLVGAIALSMDACEPVSFESIRRGSKWADLINALEFLQTIRHENPHFHLGSYFTVQAENYRYLYDFVEFCRKYRFDYVQLNMPQNWGSQTVEEFDMMNVGHEKHPEYQEFLDIIGSDVFSDPYVQLGNAADFRRKALERA